MAPIYDIIDNYNVTYMCSVKNIDVQFGFRTQVLVMSCTCIIRGILLQTIHLRVTVSEASVEGGHALNVGHVIVGSQSTGKSLTHWTQMLASLRKPIAMWHPLRSK